MYFEYNGYTSLTIPYEKDFTDFFFSGHCGALTLFICEFSRNNFKKL